MSSGLALISVLRIMVPSIFYFIFNLDHAPVISLSKDLLPNNSPKRLWPLLDNNGFFSAYNSALGFISRGLEGDRNINP